VRFVCGALFGLFVSFRLVMDFFEHATILALAIAAVVLGFGFAAARYGDKFWYLIFGTGGFGPKVARRRAALARRVWGRHVTPKTRCAPWGRVIGCAGRGIQRTPRAPSKAEESWCIITLWQRM